MRKSLIGQCFSATSLVSKCNVISKGTSSYWGIIATVFLESLEKTKETAWLVSLITFLGYVPLALIMFEETPFTQGPCLVKQFGSAKSCLCEVLQ